MDESKTNGRHRDTELGTSTTPLDPPITAHMLPLETAHIAGYGRWLRVCDPYPSAHDRPAFYLWLVTPRVDEPRCECQQ
jgi:hypothetical protein